MDNGRSGGFAFLFVLHPFADEIRAGDDAEMAALSGLEVG